MGKITKCSIKKCDNEAVGRYSPDMDIDGLKFCKEHKDRVQQGYIAIVTGSEELGKKILGDIK